MALLKRKTGKLDIKPWRRGRYVHLQDVCSGTVPRLPNSDETPVEVDCGLTRKYRYWLFRGNIYETSEALAPQEVKALATQAENRTRAKIAAAVALMDHVDQLSEHGRREPIPDDVKLFVWQRDKGACISCGQRSSLEFDHIIPLSMGGSNTARNLQLLCEGCNGAKAGNLA